MEVRLSVLENTSEQYKNLKTQLHNNASQLASIVSKYQDVSCVSRRASQIGSAKNQINTYAVHCGGLSQALNSIRIQYQNCENRVIDECDGVRTITMMIPTGVQDTTSIFAETGIMDFLSSFQVGSDLPFKERIKDFIEFLSDECSLLSKLETNSDYIDYLFDSPLFEEIADIIGTVKKTTLIKVAGYLNDGRDFLTAIQDVDLDTIDDLLEKYSKKFSMKAAEFITGEKVGLVGSTYVNIVFNSFENLREGIDEFQSEPSISAIASTIWKATAGAVYDTGTDLAEDVIKLADGVLGREFDRSDFSDAMDYLANPGNWKTVINATMDVVGDGILNAASNIGNTVASWFDW